MRTIDLLPRLINEIVPGKRRITAYTAMRVVRARNISGWVFKLTEDLEKTRLDPFFLIFSNERARAALRASFADECFEIPADPLIPDHARPEPGSQFPGLFPDRKQH